MKTKLRSRGQPLTRLQRGFVVQWRGRKWRVVMVNDCRAVLKLTHRRVVVVRDRFGKERKVREREEGVSVSPNAEVEIVAVATPKRTRQRLVPT